MKNKKPQVYKCTQGHKMKVFYTSPYRGFAVTCGTCDKEIDERDGLLHCPIDEEDYHIKCLKF